MSEKGWQIVMRAAIARDIADVPAQHRLWTPQCPPLPRFAAADPAWSPEEQAHIANCAYCQKMLGVRERLGEEEDREQAKPFPAPPPPAAIQPLGDPGGSSPVPEGGGRGRAGMAIGPE